MAGYDKSDEEPVSDDAVEAKQLADLNHPSCSKAGGKIRALIIFPPSRRAEREMWNIH